jgi:DNA-binding CsgD family transcriptional regulator
MVSSDLKKWPQPSPAKATPPPAKRSPNDRRASAPLPLSEREQQVCEYLSQGMSFETIARHLNCSPAAARAYHRRALSKRQRMIALAADEHGDHSPTAQPKSAEQPGDRRVSVRRECPNPLDLVTDFSLPGQSVTTGRSPNPQTTITDRPPHPRRKRSSRRNGWAGEGDHMAS